MDLLDPQDAGGTFHFRGPEMGYILISIEKPFCYLSRLSPGGAGIVDLYPGGGISGQSASGPKGLIIGMGENGKQPRHSSSEL
jgi:hypothetical protein